MSDNDKDADALAVELNVEEAKRLKKLESVIRKGQTAFLEVGAALAEIQVGKLYRQSHATFELYCQDRLQLGRNYAYRLISCHEVAQDLLTTGNKPTAENEVVTTSLPATERQFRQLVALSPEQRRKVWTSAVESSKTGNPTAKEVEVTRKALEADRQAVFTPVVLPPTELSPEDKAHQELRGQLERTIEKFTDWALTWFFELPTNKDREAALGSVRAFLDDTRKSLRKQFPSPISTSGKQPSSSTRSTAAN